MKKLTAVFLLLLISSVSGFSQNMKISGTVFDSTGTSPLPKAMAMAIRIKDSLLLDFTRTNEKGEFNFKNVPIDTFTLVIAHPRFDDKSFFIFGSKDNKEVNIPMIKMTYKSKSIDEVVIYANRNPIYFRGDTLVYVADSFKVGQNAVVEDLLKKLPGVKVDQDGKITSQGKEITQVLVDGDEFFGSDPTVATKNLGAKGVETVEVFEKKNENATDGQDETIQVMNLKLKADAKKGYFGKISGASDFNQFYETELLLNNFNKTQKISVFALGSNTPRSNFGNGDINKFGLDNEGGNFMNQDGEMVRFNSGNSKNGIPKTFKAGVYFTDKIGKKKQTKIGFNYSYNNYQLNALSKSRSQYFLSDTSYYSDDSTRTITENESHTFNFNLLTQIDSLTTFEIKPKVSYTTGSSDTKDYSSFLTETENLSRINSINNSTKSTSTNVQTEMTYLHKFMKPRRQIKFVYDLNYTGNNSNGNLNFKNIYYNSLSFNDTTDQSKVNANYTTTNNGKLTYTEPLTKKIKAEFEYMYENGINAQRKETRNIFGTNSTFDSTLSNNFSNIKNQNRFSTMFIYESRKHTITAGARIRNIDIVNTNLITDTIINQNFTDVLPRFVYQYKPSMTKRFKFNYNTNANQPSINDLQPVRDNTNPNKISIGNPNLKPSFSHSANINFNSWNALTGKYLWTSLSMNYTNNAFGNSTTYDSYGRQTSQTVNVNGNYNINANFGSGFPLFKKIIEISPSFNAGYSNYSNFINGEKNITVNQSITPNLEVEFKFDSLNISISGDLSYNSPKSTISSFSSKPYTMEEYKATFQWTLPWMHLKINTDATYTINGQRADGYNLAYLIWNADISKTFLKTENLILSLQANDMLNQNINAQRQVNGNIITDNKTKIISRYMLLKLTFKFNNNNTKEEDFHGWH